MLALQESPSAPCNLSHIQLRRLVIRRGFNAASAWSTVLIYHPNQSLSVLFVATVDSVARVCLDVSCVCVSAPLEWLFYVCMCIYAHIKTYKKKKNLSTSLGF